MKKERCYVNDNDIVKNIEEASKIVDDVLSDSYHYCDPYYDADVDKNEELIHKLALTVEFLIDYIKSIGGKV